MTFNELLYWTRHARGERNTTLTQRVDTTSRAAPLHNMANDLNRRLEKHVDKRILEDLRRYPPGRPDKRSIGEGSSSPRAYSGRRVISEEASTSSGDQANFTSSLIKRLVGCVRCRVLNLLPTGKGVRTNLRCRGFVVRSYVCNNALSVDKWSNDKFRLIHLKPHHAVTKDLL